MMAERHNKAVCCITDSIHLGVAYLDGLHFLVGFGDGDNIKKGTLGVCVCVC